MGSQTTHKTTQLWANRDVCAQEIFDQYPESFLKLNMYAQIDFHLFFKVKIVLAR